MGRWLAPGERIVIAVYENEGDNILLPPTVQEAISADLLQDCPGSIGDFNEDTGDYLFDREDVKFVGELVFHDSLREELLRLEEKAATKQYVNDAVSRAGASVEYYIADRASLTINEKGASFNGRPQITISQIRSGYIYELYDDLIEPAKGRGITVTMNRLLKTDPDAGTKELREYVFSPDSDYNIPSNFSDVVVDDNLQKPTFLITAGIHGDEVTTVLATYKFFEDLVYGRNLPPYLAEGAIFKVIPVTNPIGFDAEKQVEVLWLDKNCNPTKTVTTEYIRTRTNGNADINRNFDYNWKKAGPPPERPDYNTGTSAASEPETQKITEWLNSNKDAIVLIDMHISSVANHYAGVFGSRYSLATTKAKKIALRGVDKVIPYWRSLLGSAADKIKFHYACCFDHPDLPVIGPEIYYASDVLGIPAIALECVSETTQGYRDPDNSRVRVIIYDDPTEDTVSVSAEVLGNVLLETYKQEL